MRGGALLAQLHAAARAASTDDAAGAVLCDCAKAASEPYLQSLRAWLACGELDDPYCEFLVCEDKSARADDVATDFNAASRNRRHTPS